MGAALLLLPVLPLSTWGVVIPIAALVLAAATGRFARGLPWLRGQVDRWDLAAVLGLYTTIVALYRLAFVVFTQQRVLGLFLAFAGARARRRRPGVYTSWIRRRPLRSLGVGAHNLRPTLLLAVLLGGIQFVIMFWGYTLPAPVDWLPLLVLSLTVGLFEAIFFCGFVQGRLEDSLGTAHAVAGVAVLYALYHVGYGMGGDEMVFLFGLGVVYAIAYRLVRNILSSCGRCSPPSGRCSTVSKPATSCCPGHPSPGSRTSSASWPSWCGSRTDTSAAPSGQNRRSHDTETAIDLEVISVPTHPSPSQTRPEGWGIPIGVGAGAGIGLIFGIMLDQLALGLVVGAAIGLVVGASAATAGALPTGRRRIVIASVAAICAAGAAAILLIWRG